jgi:hypothetical protein
MKQGRKERPVVTQEGRKGRKGRKGKERKEGIKGRKEGPPFIRNSSFDGLTSGLVLKGEGEEGGGVQNEGGRCTKRRR